MTLFTEGRLQAFERMMQDTVNTIAGRTAKIVRANVRWSSFFVTLTRKSFDIIMPAFFFQMVSYIHLMNVGGYDCNTHIHNP